jgi:hypothetical protein
MATLWLSFLVVEYDLHHLLDGLIFVPDYCAKDLGLYL